MRKHSKLLIISLSLIIIISIVGFNYVKTEYKLSQNPKITEFSMKDIETFEKEFLLDFPEDTEFIEAQYFGGWQDSRVDVMFKIPMKFVSTFTDEMSNTYKISTTLDAIDKTNGVEAFYQCTTRQYTGIYVYSEKDDFRKFKLFYRHPSNKIKDIFK